MARNLQTKTIRKFHGLAMWPTLITTDSSWAIDLVNVMPSGSGGLEKLRVPLTLSPAIAGLSGAGNLANFQNAKGVRQAVAGFGDTFYSFALDAYTPTLQDTNLLNSGVMSFAQANNLMFVANGQRMMKWNGAALQKWGIDQMPAPQRSLVSGVAFSNPTDPPVCSAFLKGTGIARTYSISYTLVDGKGETGESPATTLALGDNEWGIVTCPFVSSGLGGAIPDPTTGVFLGAMSSGTLALRTYDVTFTWVNGAGGETMETSTVVTGAIPANQIAVVTPPGPPPPGAVGWNCYVNLTGNPRKKVNATVTPGIMPLVEPDAGWSFAGPPPPAVNATGGQALGWNCYVDVNGGSNRRRVNGDTPLAFGVDYVEPDPWGFYFHELDPTPPVANTTGGGGLPLTTGRRYRVAAGNSVTGHIGAASTQSPTTGPVSDTQIIQVVSVNPTDAQCDTLWLYATIDGGEDYYLNRNPGTADGGFPLDPSGATTITDRTRDDDLDKAIRAPLLNLPPPIGKYLLKFMGRIFVGGLPGDKQTAAYSGDERIFQGRPEESFPPNNRIRFAIGSDEIGGIGAIQAGLIVWSISNEMFLFRGAIEDNTQDAPIMFGARLDELPWKIGSASHASGAATPYGFIWHASDNTIKLFNGQGDPEVISDAITPLMRRITPGQRSDTRGVFYCQQEKEWYLFLCAIDGSTDKNCIIAFDLERIAEKNIGATVFRIQADALAVVEDVNGKSHLVIAQGGALKELQILSDTTGGITDTWTKGAEFLPAYWRSGYVGVESPEWMKLFRYARLIADRPGFRVQIYYVDDFDGKFQSPIIDPFQPVDSDRIPMNWKARYASLEIQFPEDDVPANLLGLQVSYIPTSQR